MLHTHIGMLIFFLQLICYAGLSSASSLTSAKGKQNSNTLQNQQPNFIVNLPQVTTMEVIQRITDTRAILAKRKTALAKAEKESGFNAKDGAISLILPGGFLYAAIVKLRHIDIKKQLNSVSEQLNDLNQDLLAFRADSINNTLVATLH